MAIRMKPKVNQLTENSFEVNGHHVMITKKKGRVLLLCSCSNSARFADNNFCWGKELVLEYLFKKPIKDKLDKLIKLYSDTHNLGLKISQEGFIDDLNSIRRIL